jgi:hypothetical protein
MQRLSSDLLPSITDHLSLHHKLTQLTHISRTFPPLTPSCFRHDALEVTQPLLERVKTTNTVPPHIGAVDTLLFECESRSQLDLFVGLVSASPSSSSSISTSPSLVLPFSQRVRCLFFSVFDYSDTLSSALITQLPVLLPFLSSLRLSTSEEPWGIPRHPFRALSSLPHLTSLSLVGFTLSEESLDQLSQLPVIQLDLHGSRMMRGYLPLPPPREPTGGKGRCTTLLMPRFLVYPANPPIIDQLMTCLLTRLCAASSSSSSTSLCVGLERLCVPEGAGAAQGAVERWLALCPSLVVLDIRDVGPVSDGEMESILRAMVNEAGLPTLRRLQHCSFPSLQCGLQTRWSHDVVSACVRVLTAYSSQLLTVDVGCEVDEEEAEELMAAVLQCGGLTSLHLAGWWWSSSVVVPGPPRLPSLISLSLDLAEQDEDASLKEAQLASILDHCPHLHSLVFRWCCSTPLDVLLWIDQRCPDLRLLLFERLIKLSSRIEDPARWAAATTATVAFPSLVSLTMTRHDTNLHPLPVVDLIALLRLAPRLHFLHLNLARIAPEQVIEFAALRALRGLRLGAANNSQTKQGERLRQRYWRKAGGDPEGVAAQYSRVQHSKTGLWCSPHLRPDWIGRAPINVVVDADGRLFRYDCLLRSAPCTEQEIEDDFWSWGVNACDVFVDSVDGVTGRQAFFAAFDPLSSWWSSIWWLYLLCDVIVESSSVREAAALMSATWQPAKRCKRQ